MKILFKLFAIVIFLLSFTVFAGHITSVQATTTTNPNDVAKKYGITFPINDLGGCTDLAACKTYCQDPANQTSCMEFAKKKGFNKKMPTKSQEILNKAKSELGCDSIEACKGFCTSEANLDKCNNFARKYSVGALTQDPSDAQILQKAKETLGCDSYKSCFLLCSQDANRQKCSEFAKKVNLKGGVEVKGPGDCKTTATCQSYCREHPDICKKYLERQTNPTTFSPRPDMGNCQTPTACYQWCRQNPGKCQNFRPDTKPPTAYSPNVTPRPYDETKPSTSPSVHGAKTGPDWFTQTVDSVVNFLTSIF